MHPDVAIRSPLHFKPQFNITLKGRAAHPLVYAITAAMIQNPARHNNVVMEHTPEAMTDSF